MKSLQTDVLIVGSSLSANMTALNLKHRNPTLDVCVLGPRPDEEKRPLVGESLVEPGILFFREVGMGPYLDSRQVMKNGLCFYHKLDLANPADRAYSTHAPQILFHKARQLRRVEFDQACRDRVAELGGRLLHGQAKEIEVGKQAHRVVAVVDGEEVEIRSRWIVDATGRKRMIGSKVTTYARPEEQRCTFWFRLARFEPFLSKIDAKRRRDWQYDLWLTTHHFMGKGYWIWCIPQDLGDDNLCSIGFTYRPDLFPKRIRTMEDFFEQVDQDHPAVSEMVRSGEVCDRQMYFDYHYRAERMYSEDGWFLVGDTARTVDPLYSNGISMTTLQVGQIAEIIERQRDGRLEPGDVDTLDQAGRWVMERAQREVTNQYPIMHDPFQASLRRYLNVTQWFNAYLPLWFNGFFTSPEGAKMLLRLFKDRDEDAESLWVLGAEASAAIGPPYKQEDFDRGPDIDKLLNLRFDCAREDVMEVVGRSFARRREIRWTLLKMTGYRSLLREVPRLVGEIVRPLALRLLPYFNRALFDAVRPPLRDQYARWTGPDRDVPEDDGEYIGRTGLAPMAEPEAEAVSEAG